RTFRERFPDVELTLREITTVEQVQALREDRIQVGFLRLPISADNIEFEPVQREPFFLVISAKHPLASLPEIPLCALEHEPFIFVPHALAPGLYDQMMSICVQAGFHPRIVQEAIQYHVIISLVAAGLGVTLVPSSIQTFQRADVVYRPLQHVTIQAEIVAVWRRDDLSPVLRSFLQVVREHAHTELSSST
ncbi:MAG: LysR family substrate-binding domain-containing protein, partial [Chloroflexi bacterium]|nr:LysR family substrate-binding domain-containing protein [Chloroflexota bacterium]